MSAGNKLQMEDQILEVYRALDKNEVENKENLKQHKQKDSRNLYLIKEGGKYYKKKKIFLFKDIHKYI